MLHLNVARRVQFVIGGEKDYQETLLLVVHVRKQMRIHRRGKIKREEAMSVQREVVQSWVRQLRAKATDRS